MRLKNYYLKFKVSQDGEARVSATSLNAARKVLQEKIPHFLCATTIHTDGVKADITTAKITNIKKESK